MDRPKVMGVEGIQDRAQDTPLRLRMRVEGVSFPQPHSLGTVGQEVMCPVPCGCVQDIKTVGCWG